MQGLEQNAYGNPSSIHSMGQKSRGWIEQARREVAHSIGVLAQDIIFTSGGTESCNLGILGMFESIRDSAVLTSGIEHPAVKACMVALNLKPVVLKSFEKQAIKEQLKQEECKGIICQWVNHELGTIHPIETLSELALELNLPFFVDACQAFGKIPLVVGALSGISALALAASKCGGPLGAGALYARRDLPLASHALGGSQERGRRAGTPDPIRIAGFGHAASLIDENLAAQPALRELQSALDAALTRLGGKLNTVQHRVATVSNASFEKWKSSLLVVAMDLEGICVSSGAACSSGVDAPSSVLLAAHPNEPERAISSIRISMSASSTKSDIDKLISTLENILAR